MIRAKNVVKRYSDVLALDTLNIEIKEGDIFGLLGPNGAGKTTFINCLIGMTTYESGEILVGNMTLKKDEMAIKRQLGVVPQDLAIYMNETAYNNVKYFASLYGLKGKELKKSIEVALRFVGLWDKRGTKPKTFSGGMKRRLNIACAIAHNPKIVIMDESTVGIDPQSRNHIIEAVRELNNQGVTVIYTSHYMEEVEILCNQVAIIDHGKLIAEGTKESLKRYVQSERIIEVEVASSNFTQIEAVK